MTGVSVLQESPRLRAGATAVVAVAVALLIAMTGWTSSASASSNTAATSGWIRVAHLSPDTREVDVSLTKASGGAPLFTLTEVGYGAVSAYSTVPAGDYVLSMKPSTARASDDALVSAAITVSAAKSITVAAFGNNRDLQTRVFTDDLTSPDPGSSRIRLIQASTVTDKVSVATTTGLQIARDAEAGESTNYASVPAGPWDLQLTASGIEDVAKIDLGNGSVNTLFVVDNASGGLTVMPVVDSAAVGAAPIGGVQTGGGALATHYAKGFAGSISKR